MTLLPALAADVTEAFLWPLAVTILGGVIVGLLVWVGNCARNIAQDFATMKNTLAMINDRDRARDDRIDEVAENTERAHKRIDSIVFPRGA